MSLNIRIGGNYGLRAFDGILIGTGTSIEYLIGTAASFFNSVNTSCGTLLGLLGNRTQESCGMEASFGLNLNEGELYGFQIAPVCIAGDGCYDQVGLITIRTAKGLRWWQRASPIVGFHYKKPKPKDL